MFCSSLKNGGDLLSKRSALRVALKLEQLEDRRLLSSTPNSFVLEGLESLSGVTRTVVPDEVIVALRADSHQRDFDSILAKARFETYDSFLDNESGSEILRYEHDAQNLMLVQFKLEGIEVGSAIDELTKNEQVVWAAPNYRYSGNVLDLIPNDTQYASQYHHPLMNTPLAWDTTLGSSNIVIAVTDQGVQTDHPDLAANIWQNAGEIAGNGLDDDANGFIDDTHGWDFVSNDNNANPNVTSDDHGTHVAGIAAGITNNAIGIAGVAGGSRIMPIRIQGSDGGFTSIIMANTFRYAIDNGARITNTSYNIDGFVNDPTFTAGLQYYYDNGGLHFNSAGNNSQLNPARQAFHQTLLVANTTSTDAKSGTSNSGTGVDISAPGTSILATITGSGYGSKSGTSMAAPNAAGVAALVWSANPTWTRDQVAAAVVGTADNIDAANPTLIGLLGSGRVNAGRAITASLAPPRVAGVTSIPSNGASVPASTLIEQFTVRFNQIMSPAAVNAAGSVRLTEAGANGVHGDADDFDIGITRLTNYMIGTNQVNYRLTNGRLGVGRYRFSIDSSVVNPFNTALDGNGDGSGGDAYLSNFEITPPNLEPMLPLGSLVGSVSVPDSITTPTDSNNLSFDIASGQSISVLVKPMATSLRPVIEIFDPSGASMVVQTAATIGQSALVQNLPVSSNGVHNFTVRSADGTLGPYSIQIIVNATFEEEEAVISAGNNTLASAQDLTSSFETIQTSLSSVQRGSVVGRLTDAGVGVDFDSGILPSSIETGSYTETGSIDPLGRIRVKIPDGTGNTSPFALMMDRSVSGANTLNEAIWTVDLAGLVNPLLSFSHVRVADEANALPASFTGRFNGDGVSISADGITWQTVLSAPTNTTWTTSTINLTAAATQAGMTLGNNFKIKFQQFDNFPLTTDGRGYDNLKIVLGEEDWYRLPLTAGERISVALEAIDTGSASFDIVDAAGITLVSAATGATNVDRFIESYGAPSSGDYWLKVTGTANTTYNLMVLKGAAFDYESNDVSPTAKNISGHQGVLGNLSNDDWYRITVASQGDRLWFKTATPKPGPGFPNNLVNPNIQLYSPTGAVVAQGVEIDAAGNETLEYLNIPEAGEYRLRVSRSGAAQGDYFVSLKLGLTNFVMSNSSVPEDSPLGTTIGSFSSSAEGTVGALSYALVTGPGDVDNGAFVMDGGVLRTNQLFDFETKASYSIRVRVTDQASFVADKIFPIAISNVALGQVADRRLFYNRSINPVFGNGSGNPINAIDPTKQALLPGQTTTEVNYTNYSRGLNGIVIDISNSENLLGISAASFQFATWTDFSNTIPNFVTINPNVTVSTFAGGGLNGSDRVKLEFDNNAIQNAWLRVTMLANGNTGLSSNDVFYFGNARFDVTPSSPFPAQQVTINAFDVNSIRAQQGQNSGIISNIFDVDRSGVVNAFDVNAVRAGQGVSSLRSFTAPSSSQFGLALTRSNATVSNVDSVFVDTSWLEAFQIDDQKRVRAKRR